MSMFRRPTDISSDSDSESEPESDDDESHDGNHSESLHDQSHGSSILGSAGTEEITSGSFGAGPELTRSETLGSSTNDISRSFYDSGGNGGTNGNDVINVEQHRNMMLASLLEDFYRTRAAEILNAAARSSTSTHAAMSARPDTSGDVARDTREDVEVSVNAFDRHSPEVQDLATTLYAQASQTLTATGVLPKNITGHEQPQRDVRQRYIAGLDTLGMQNILNVNADDVNADINLAATNAKNVGTIGGRVDERQPMGPEANEIDDEDFGEKTMAVVPFSRNLSRVANAIANNSAAAALPRDMSLLQMSRPTSDLRLSAAVAGGSGMLSAPRSHYRSHFEERSLLGKGGFGRVYHTYNVFDQAEYAVKKIPLSHKLSQRYREGGCRELAHVLKEVQALAKLNHCNVVRYHATWIEEPTAALHTSMANFNSPAASNVRMMGMGASPRLAHSSINSRGQRLIEDKPRVRDEDPKIKRSAYRSYTKPGEDHALPSMDKGSKNEISFAFSDENDNDDDDPFDRDGEDGAGANDLEWSFRPDSHSCMGVDRDASSLPASELFTDGHPRDRYNSTENNFYADPSVYILHVQMSMYPMTLKEYLSPSPTPVRSYAPTAAVAAAARSGAGADGFRHTSCTGNPPLVPPRHCFHLLPSLRILLNILCGLQYIHARGLIHRDIKPGNVFLSVLEQTSSPVAPAEGYADVGSCMACPPTPSPTCSAASISSAGTRAPRFINPRIGDFGLVAELAKEATGASSPASASDLNPRADAIVDSSESVKAAGTEYYRPPPPLPPAPQKRGRDGGRTVHRGRADNNGGGERKPNPIDEKLDVFALGVIFVELLWPCGTHSERIHLLRDLQKGTVPAKLIGRIRQERHFTATPDACDDRVSSDHDEPRTTSRTRVEISRRVQDCLHGMIDPDPERRWSCARVKDRLEDVLCRCTGTDGDERVATSPDGLDHGRRRSRDKHKNQDEAKDEDEAEIHTGHDFWRNAS